MEGKGVVSPFQAVPTSPFHYTKVKPKGFIQVSEVYGRFQKGMCLTNWRNLVNGYPGCFKFQPGDKVCDHLRKYIQVLVHL